MFNFDALTELEIGTYASFPPRPVEGTFTSFLGNLVLNLYVLAQINLHLRGRSCNYVLRVVEYSEDAK